MKIFITYPTDLQYSIILGLYNCLAKNGMDVLVWNRTTKRYFTNNEYIFRDNISFLKKLQYIKSLRYLFLFRSFLYLFVSKGLKGIDILNYQCHDRECDMLIPFLNKRKVNLIISIWGSDLYRISEKTRKKRQILYDKVNLIHVESPVVRKDFLFKYHIDENKVFVCNFGIDLFENIDRFREQKEIIKRNLLPGIAQNRIVVTCGYNARQGQQHKVMINQLRQLPLEYKKKLFIVFPLTYSAPNDSVLDVVYNYLSNLDIPYCCFTEQLDLESLAKLRVISDIVINIQITDSLSTSLLEYFYAGNIMLLGEWLPYHFLIDQCGMSYIPVSVKDIADKIQLLISHYKEEKKLALKNVEKTYSLASWDSVSCRFVNMFEKMYKDRC